MKNILKTSLFGALVVILASCGGGNGGTGGQKKVTVEEFKAAADKVEAHQYHSATMVLTSTTVSPMTSAEEEEATYHYTYTAEGEWTTEDGEKAEGYVQYLQIDASTMADQFIEMMASSESSPVEFDYTVEWYINPFKCHAVGTSSEEVTSGYAMDMSVDSTYVWDAHGMCTKGDASTSMSMAGMTMSQEVHFTISYQ